MGKSADDSDFAAAVSRPRRSAAGELWAFLRQNKKWWLTPIVVAVVLFGLLVLLTGTGAAPFIYTLF